LQELSDPPHNIFVLFFGFLKFEIHHLLGRVAFKIEGDSGGRQLLTSGVRCRESEGLRILAVDTDIVGIEYYTT